eukprot:TRINITY_DN58351_c0_g1_i2.p1 TRINITY_DN58351_c0_g1~~TRINITY_DN58351_c0_g1_i2.p1  ORF type:complete len:403 (-),score=42.06 TRINITY_DN58351_c0_g1_i2:127-1335(-)
MTKPSVFALFGVFVDSQLPALVVIGILSEARRGSRICLFLGALSGFAAEFIARFCSSMSLLNASEVVVAVSMSSRFARAAVIFELVPADQAQRCIHSVQAAYLVSNALSALAGEALLDGGVPMHYLNDTTVAWQAVTCVVGLLLLSVPRCPHSEEPCEPCDESEGVLQKARSLTLDLLASLRIPAVFLWTLWGICVVAVHTLTMTFWQNLVKEKAGTSAKDHNGLAAFVQYCATGLLVFATRRSALLRGNALGLGLASAATAGAALCFAAYVQDQVLLYASLLIFECVTETIQTVCAYQVGHALNSASMERSPTSHWRVRRSHLTLLLSLTAVGNSVLQIWIKGATKGLSVEATFYAMGVGLLSYALVLAVGAALHCGLSSLRRKAPDPALEASAGSCSNTC